MNEKNKEIPKILKRFQLPIIIKVREINPNPLTVP